MGSAVLTNVLLMFVVFTSMGSRKSTLTHEGWDDGLSCLRTRGASVIKLPWGSYAQKILWMGGARHLGMRNE